jgi:chitinase
MLSDPWADLQFPYPGDNTSTPGTNVYGNVKQLFLLKKKYRSLKTLLSIGGWGYRENFPPMLASEALRQTFSDSAINMVANLGFDGIDIDYEYATGEDQADQIVDLLQKLRCDLDSLAEQINATTPYTLSFCSPASETHYSQLDFPRMTPLVDYYNFMAVDYMGPGFSNYSGFLANLFPDFSNPNATDFDTNSGMLYYILQGGVPPEKIVMENPLYGRAFNGTTSLGTNFTDGGSLGSYGSAGIWDYFDLPVPGFNATVVNVPEVGGSYSHDAEKGYIISYDTPEIARMKAQYAMSLGLAGISWYEISMDRNDTESLITNTVSQLGGVNALDSTFNNLNYPTSIYDNLRAGFPDS